MSDEYRVQLDIYNGPLDLLLYLIRREEVDIYDIPIARITEQYMAYVEVLRQIDPNAAGEFLVLASMLMEIKSRTLLPRPPVEEEEDFEDPRLELVRQLLEYKKFKDAAEHLRESAETRAQRFARQPAEIQPDSRDDVEIESLGMWDLVEAFREVMTRVGRLVPHEIQYDDTPVALHAADIADRLQREDGSMEFARIFEGRTRSECIGLFLALLELIRQRRVRAEQEESFGPIYIHLLSTEPIVSGQAGVAAFGTQQMPEPEDEADREEVPEGKPASSIESQPDEDRETAVPDSFDDVDEDDLGEMPEVPELGTLTHSAHEGAESKDAASPGKGQEHSREQDQEIPEEGESSEMGPERPNTSDTGEPP